jgi:hypothetical protein
VSVIYPGELCRPVLVEANALYPRFNLDSEAIVGSIKDGVEMRPHDIGFIITSYKKFLYVLAPETIGWRWAQSFTLLVPVSVVET